MTTTRELELARQRANQAGDIADLRHSRAQLLRVDRGAQPRLRRWLSEQRIPFLESAIAARASDIEGLTSREPRL